MNIISSCLSGSFGGKGSSETGKSIPQLAQQYLWLLIHKAESRGRWSHLNGVECW